MGTTSSTLNNLVNSKVSTTKKSLNGQQQDNNNNASANKSIKIWCLDNLQMQKQIGQGPYGIVLEAKNIKNQQQCAMKIIEYSNKNDNIYKYAVEKSIKLIEATTKLIDHPNIMKTYVCQALDVDINILLKSRFSFVMELYEDNLKTYINKLKQRNKHFTEIELLNMLMQLSYALMDLNNIGINHHNLKEENIFIKCIQNTTTNNTNQTSQSTSNHYDKHTFHIQNNDQQIGQISNELSKDLNDNLINNNDKGVELTKIITSNNRYIIGDIDICDVNKKIDNKALLYYAPEMINSNFSHSQHTTIEKSDVYALGIIMVKTALSLDNFTTNNRDNILDYVQQLNYKYNILYKILIRMLDKSVSKRLKFEEIFKYCQGHVCEIQKIYDPNYNILSTIQNQIKCKMQEGIQFRESDNYIKAIKCFDEAQNMIFDTEHISFCDRILNANCLKERGLAFEKLKDVKSALDDYKKSLEVRITFLHGYGVSDCLFSIGCIHYQLEDYQAALLYFIKSYNQLKKDRNFYDNDNDNDRILSITIKYLEKIAFTYEKLKDFNNALEINIICLKTINDNKGNKNQLYIKKLKTVANGFKKFNNNEIAKELNEMISSLEFKDDNSKQFLEKYIFI